MSNKKKNGSGAALGKLISAVVYAALIGVVNYGRHHYVYDGFSPVVPMVIMGIFAVMAVIRLIGFWRLVMERRGLWNDSADSEKDISQ